MAGLDNDVYKCERDEYTLSAAGEFTKVNDGTNTICQIISAGSPEGVHAADICSVAYDATNGVIYVKTTDTVNTGWSAVPSGSASYTAGSVIFSNGTILTEDNSNFFWDDTNNRLGIGTLTPLETLHVAGAMELDHTASENDDHAIEIICDAAGFSDVKALNIDYITGALAAGEDEEAILVNIDESASTGGIIAGYLCLTTSEGSAVVNGYETGININPISHQSGTFGDADNILNKLVDVTAALAFGGVGAISIFVADNDTITIGDAAQWGEYEIILATGASGAGVAPTFEYSTGGAAFSAFVPADGTNGFRNSGAILWDESSLAGWATATSGLYEIRITRTRNSLSTTPIIDELQISALTEYKWDKDGNVNLNSLTLVTDLAVAHGGTGASTLTGVLTGNGASAITANAVTQHAVLLGGASNAVADTAAPTDGQLLVGATSAAPNLITSWMQQGNNCWFWNLSFTHAAGTLTLAGADGTALSATNPGYVCIPSNATEGRMVLHKIVANDTLTVSDLTGNLFRTTTAIAWANALPMYIGFMADSADANLEPIITRLPHIPVSPAASTDIGDPSAANADEQFSVFAWNDITEANYQDMQVGLIGSLRATKAVTTDAWTLTAMDARDGVGRWNDSRPHTMPLGQNGAVAGTYILANAGTEPVFATNTSSYYISRSGYIIYDLRSIDVNNTPAGAQVFQWILPYESDVINIGFTGGVTYQGSTGTLFDAKYAITAGNISVGTNGFRVGDNTTAAGQLTNASLSTGADIEGRIMYGAGIA